MFLKDYSEKDVSCEQKIDTAVVHVLVVWSTTRCVASWDIFGDTIKQKTTR